MYIPQYKVSRMKVRNKWTHTGGIGVNGLHLTDTHKGKFLKRGEGRGKRGEKRERVTPGLPD